MILAGDVGGTKTVLALFDRTATGLRDVRDQTFVSREYPSLEVIIGAFLRDAPAVQLEAACFGVAGPVHEGRVQTTNLPWHLAEDALAVAIGAPRVKLLNDLQATAYGMLRLAPDEFEILQPGAGDAPGNAGVIAPGTGLGESMLVWDGRRHLPIASEGGHADFAARTDREIELLQHLRRTLGGRVSYERVLSGDGIHHIYRFLRDSGHAPEPAWLRDEIEQGDANAAITRIGLAGAHPLCVAALETFAEILGAEAGNLALRCVATGGIFVGGGIPPKILPALRTPPFLRGFTDKGRFSEWMTTIPVRVALNPRAPLLGAAHFVADDGGATRER